MSLNFLCEPNQFHNYAMLHFEFVRVVSWHSVEERSQVLTLNLREEKQSLMSFSLLIQFF